MAKRNYKFGGVNNVLDPAEMNQRVDRFAPYTEMVSGVNVDISDRRAVHRRAGQTLVNPLAGHSLWSNGSQAYFVYNLGLYAVTTGYAAYFVTALTSDAPMAYEEINNTVVYSNGSDLGCLVNGAVSSPDDTSKVGRIPTRPGVCLTFFNSRLLVGSGDGVLYYTDPYDLDWMEEDNCRIPLGGLPTMVEAVDNGVWVSTPERLAFLSGEDAGSFSWKVQGDYPAIGGATMVVDTEALRMRDLPGKKAAVWASTNGICIGTANGDLINLSEERYSYAPGQRGAIILREQEGLVHIIASISALSTNYSKDTTSITPVRHNL
jgi:hypothetical protein